MRHVFFVTLMVSALVFVGCSADQKARNVKEREPTDSSSLLKDTRITTEFNEDGIKLTYTQTGTLESIEVTGIAESWRGETQARLIAETDAFNKLVKFIHGSSVKNSQRTKIIAKSLEIAKDRSVSTKNPTEEEVNFSDEEITKNVALSKDNAEQNKNIRNASMVNQITTETISEITSKGKLRGVRKIKEYTQNEGKTFVAVYTWSSRDNSAASEMRKKMTEKN